MPGKITITPNVCTNSAPPAGAGERGPAAEGTHDDAVEDTVRAAAGGAVGLLDQRDERRLVAAHALGARIELRQLRRVRCAEVVKGILWDLQPRGHAVSSFTDP